MRHLLWFLEGVAQGAGIAVLAALIVLYLFPGEARRDDEEPQEGMIEI